MAVDLGQLYRATYTVFDATGALTDATVSLAVKQPDRTAAPGSPFTPVHDSLGQYHVDYAATPAGLHELNWSSTGPTTAKTDWLEVRQFASLISFADARAMLSEQSTLQDEEIRSFMETATGVVEDIVGPCVIRTFIDQVDTNDGYCLLLPRAPVVSVTSLVPVFGGGASYVTADLLVNPDTGIVTLKTRGAPLIGGPWTATYVAGRSVISPIYVQAAKETLWDLWPSQRGATADSTSPDLLDVAEFEPVVTIPSLRVQRMLDLEPGLPGFA